MRKPSAFTYIGKYRWLILAFVVIGAYAAFRYSMSIQFHTASATIQYTSEQLQSAVATSSKETDSTEIIGDTVIVNAINDICNDEDLDFVRSHISVSVTDLQNEQSKATSDLGEQPAPLDDCKITVTSDGELSPKYSGNILDRILSRCFSENGKKLDSPALPDKINGISPESYDYIDCAQMLESSSYDMLNYLDAHAKQYPDFRSAASGRSFSDLADSYRFFYESTLPSVYSSILTPAVSTDKAALVTRCRNLISEYQIEITNTDTYITEFEELTSSYGNKVPDRAEYNFGIKSNADGSYSIDTDENNSVKTIAVTYDTTYDELIKIYTALRSYRADCQRELERAQKYLSVFTLESPTVATDSAEEAAEAQITAAVTELDSLYKTVLLTVDDFYAYNGAENIKTVSGIATSDALDVRFCVIVSALALALFGCCTAIIAGKATGAARQHLYIDRITGLPNRTRYDTVVKRLAKKPLRENFTCVSVALAESESCNGKYGCSDEIALRRFAEILENELPAKGYIGYNGEKRFIGFFENLSDKRVRSCMEKVKTAVMAYNQDNGDMLPSFSYGVSDNTENGITDIRSLIRASESDLRAYRAGY